MFDFLKRIVDSPLASVTLMGFIIAGLIFLVRLETDVRHLQEDVSQLQQDMDKLQVSMATLAANQQRILDALESIEFALANHTHDEEGRAVMPLPRSR